MMTMDLASTAPTPTTMSARSLLTATTLPLSTNDIKQQFKHVYNSAKQFDQLKQSITTLTEVFNPRLEVLRTEIVERSTALIYQTEYEAIGKRSREILWFKGYYDLISLAKRLWKKCDSVSDRPEEQMSNLIIEGIAHFKSTIVQLERKFNLDLRNIVDFSFLDTYEKNLYATAAIECNGSDIVKAPSPEATKYAMETIHALLISLGDLHRYFIDFNFNMPKISKDFAANYYFEAFKLNPKTGMAHNQLGTLLAGVNYDLDSIYHYLYSLVCPIPFELSDINVVKLFQSNSSYLEKIEGNDKLDVIGVRDLIARYILIVDVFFYDKDINDFNALCHCLLIDFRKMLQSKRMVLSSDILYKMIAILFFCLAKLKSLGSNKVHHLNALLVAICAEMIGACTMKLERFIADKSVQNEKFQLKYGKRFDEFERNVRNARESHKRYLEQKSPIEREKIDSDRVKPFKMKIFNCSDDPINTNGKIFSDKLSIESADYIQAAKISNGIGSDDRAGGSSERERESDMGKLSASSQTKNKKKAQQLRRRRKRMASENSDSDLSYFEDSASEYEMDTDFSSDVDSVDENDEEWDSSDDEANGDNKPFVDNTAKKQSTEVYNEPIAEQVDIGEAKEYSDNDDIVIEEEEIVYLNGNNNNNSFQFENSNLKNDLGSNVFDCFVQNLNKLQLSDDAASDDMIIEEEQIIFNPFSDVNQNGSESNANTNEELSPVACNGIDTKTNLNAPEKLRYKQKYNKCDPNIIIEFAEYENSMQALKILFDWLRINSDILINCFTTNPEFIDKIFILLNHMNIDIFTRKVFFEREHIETENVRENLRSLFDARTEIPLHEDVLLKEFSIFDQCQHSIDWEMPLKMKISEKEENILRVFKFIDFGFTVCKMKKFKYNFCSRSRQFIQLDAGKRSTAKRNRTRGKRDKRRRRNRSRNRGNYIGKIEDNDFPKLIGQTTGSSNDDLDDVEEKKSGLKKGYLKNRQNQNQLTVSKLQVDTLDKNATPAGEKHEIMGKLWLQHEIEVLEAKVSKNHIILTPYLVVDTKALIDHLAIVKNLVKAKKFVVLIPKAVLAEMDELKKTSELARNSIRWLEREFTKGSRFIRLQRNNETKPLSLIKVPKKLDREAATFVQIAQFCNFMNENHTTNAINNTENNIIQNGARPNVVTFLTGDRLSEKKLTNFSFTGIMNALSIHFEQINTFYGKYKKK